jgi:hypothetical protein
VLAQFAFIVFAMCAVLSLIIDIGYARLTQAQMQNAADSAALEGLRQRDVVPGDAGASDLRRRAAANRVVHWTFDDDFDSTNGDPDHQFGAGPIIDLTDGVTNLHALQTVSVPEVRVYKPDLQLNQENAARGDMVSGSFSYSAESVPPEDPEYVRNDFAPGAANSAFLVRLRRSNEFRDLAGQTELDVASSGPSLPLVFGKGTLIFGDDSALAYSPRRDGLTVRATAIAAARPALHVGLPQPQSIPPLPGVMRFALLDTCIENATGAPVTINVTVNPATGVISRSVAGPPPCPVAGSIVGRFVADPTTISTVGRIPPPAPVAVACLSVNSSVGYGPVYSVMSSGTSRIIGFARTSWTRNPCPFAPGAAFTATISRGTSLVAASNATVNLIGGLPLPANTRPADVTELLQRNGSVAYGPVLVPVLAR